MLMMDRVDFTRVANRSLMLRIAEGQVNVDGEIVCRVSETMVGLAPAQSN